MKDSKVDSKAKRMAQIFSSIYEGTGGTANSFQAPQGDISGGQPSAGTHAYRLCWLG